MALKCQSRRFKYSWPEKPWISPSCDTPQALFSSLGDEAPLGILGVSVTAEQKRITLEDMSYVFWVES